MGVPKKSKKKLRGEGLSSITSHLFRAVSSVVEHYLDTVGVTGSNPVSRTILSAFAGEVLERFEIQHLSCLRRKIGNVAII